MDDLHDRLTAIESMLAAIASDLRAGKPSHPRRRRHARRTSRPLTRRQAEVVAAVVRNGGVLAWAAADLQISPQAVAKVYRVAMQKLPDTLTAARRGRPEQVHADPLPEDHRGNVSVDADERAEITT